ncbi:MOSC domain-containing protein [Celerinatantimonas yamalensis]|uniref:MOSC domain-containing protein n=1 Tax=Celerinatantimonas yamalensis TaxID=559956 RepID=A0ABW9G2S8_9GAMM
MAQVVSVSKSSAHHFSKQVTDAIQLIENEGVDGDAHRGVNVQHRSRVKVDPTQANLRQVHLIHIELIEQLQAQGFNVNAGTMGENITTMGIELLDLPCGAQLGFPSGARVEVTGLRNPCAQLNHYQKGLTQAVLERDAQGKVIRKAGVMGVVVQGGWVYPDDAIEVILPAQPHSPLACV